jgi:hypothetical protein
LARALSFVLWLPRPSDWPVVGEPIHMHMCTNLTWPQLSLPTYNMSGATKPNLRDSVPPTGSLQATKDCTSCFTSGQSVLDYCKPCRDKWTEERSRAADEMERNERERTVSLLATTDTEHKAASSDTQTNSKFSPRLGDEFKPLTVKHTKQNSSASKSDSRKSGLGLNCFRKR